MPWLNTCGDKDTPHFRYTVRLIIRSNFGYAALNASLKSNNSDANTPKSPWRMRYTQSVAVEMTVRQTTVLQWRWTQKEDRWCCPQPCSVGQQKVCRASLYFIWCRDSSVSIATRYGVEVWERIPMGASFSTPSRPALGTIRPAIWWVPGLFPRGKAAGAWL